MVREHQSCRHKTHEFLHVNKDILRQKQDNSTTKTKLSPSKNRAIMQQKQGYRRMKKGLSYNEKRTIVQ
jgi:hypothetical protein